MTKLKWIAVAILAVLAIAVLIWLWGAPGGIIGALSLGGLFGHRLKKKTANAALDTAVELGSVNVAAANEQADKEIEDGMSEHDNLADYLNSLDDQ